MALEGSLKDFSVLDILQLVSNQQKTGTLTITSPRGTIVVDFKKGLITGAYRIKKGQQVLLDEYLLTSGRISEENLSKAKSSHVETGLPWDEILIRDGYITEAEFKEIVTFKIQEVIDELFMWNEGSYRFELGKELYRYSRVKVSLRTEALIMEGARRMDELPRIREVLPDENILIEKTGKVLPGLGPVEKKLLSLLSHPSTVAELALTARLGEFRTYEALFNMIRSGVARTAGIKEPEVVRVERPRRLEPRKLLESLLVSSVGIAIVFGLWVKRNEGGGIGPIPFKSYNQWSTEHRLESLENSLRIFFIMNGRYPESLEELCELGLASRRDTDRFEYIAGKDFSCYELNVFSEK